MPNLIDTGAVWLLDRLQESAGRAMTYRRGAERIEFTGVRGSIVENVVGLDGTPEAVRRHWVVIDVADLVDGRGQQIEPRAGHQISEAVGTLEVVWEIVPSGDGPCFEWWGHGRQAYRMFVIQVA